MIYSYLYLQLVLLNDNNTHQQINVISPNQLIYECKPPFMPIDNLTKCNANYKINTTYLPSSSVLIPYLESIETKNNAQNEFRSIQFPTYCDKMTFHLINLPEWGIASIFKHISKMIGRHWASNIGVLNSHSKWRYSDGKCHNNDYGWSCFLSPISNCSLNLNSNSIISWIENVDHHHNNESDFVLLGDTCSANKKYGKYNINNGICECIDGFIQRHGLCINKSLLNKEYIVSSYDVPGEITLDAHDCRVKSALQSNLELMYGSLYYSSQVLWFLFKNAPNRYILDQYVNSLNIINNKYIAVHIRHGDSCDDIIHQFKRKCFDFNAYIDKINEIRNMYDGYNKIYVSTDSNEIEKDIIKWNGNKSKEFMIITQSMNRNIYNMNGGYIDHNDDIKGSVFVEELMKDIWTMSYCDIFIGDFTSSVARVTYELMVYHKKYYPPYIVLTAPWCDNTQRFTYKGEEFIC